MEIYRLRWAANEDRDIDYPMNLGGSKRLVSSDLGIVLEWKSMLVVRGYQMKVVYQMVDPFSGLVVSTEIIWKPA